MAQYRAVNPLASVDAAYIAGLIDGEGTITLSRKHAADKRHLAIPARPDRTLSAIV